ncbi:PDGLE domain-containing protein [Desulfolucanica intricata]|uniref:PDGLE domain-containing protein n=1 Tax=Desulfolucanica intricata TaxID=1285191 RepID=UPI0008362940|nr:PDGLE domain-containing protein [Desulfolucanica intricata]
MKKLLLASFVVALLVAALMSPFASSSPDGLERVAEDKGFLHKAEGQEVIKSPIPDYVFPGLKNEAVATSVAGVAGTVLTFGFLLVFGKILSKKTKP